MGRGGCHLNYDGDGVMLPLLSTAELAANVAGAATASHGNASLPGAQSELHCSGLRAVSGRYTGR